MSLRLPVAARTSNSQLVLSTGEVCSYDLLPPAYFRCYYSDIFSLIDMFKNPWPRVMTFYMDLVDEANESRANPVLIIGKEGAPPFCLFQRGIFCVKYPYTIMDLEYQVDTTKRVEHYPLRLMLWEHFLESIAPHD